MSSNSGAWGVAMWRDDSDTQANGISLEGGDPIIPYLPTTPVGCLKLPPDGLGVPGQRIGDVTFAQTDGVVQFEDFYENRIITLQVSICNEGCPGCASGGLVDTYLLLDGVSPGRATTPDSAALDITGDIDLRVNVAMDDWTPAASAQALVGKWTTSGNQRSYLLRIEATTGFPRLFWSPDGTTLLSATATAAPTVTNGSPLWVRATLDVDNGAGGRSIRFYTSTDGSAWTQLGSTVTQAGVTSILNSTAEVEVGSIDTGVNNRLAGKVYYVEVRDSIDGTVVANPDFTALTPGVTSFNDSAGNVWTVVPPGTIAGTPAVLLSAREKVKLLLREWSRTCTGATLAIFPDCYNPGATNEERVINGPYLVRGRPRIAEVTWIRSNRGCADVLLRFDAQDHRLVILPEENDSATPWTGTLCEDVLTATSDARTNDLLDPRLRTSTWNAGGSTSTTTVVTTGGPHNQGYRQRVMTTVNTGDMEIDLSGTGLSARPIVAGQKVYLSAYWYKSITTGVQRFEVDWYDAAGALLSSTTGTDLAIATANVWWRAGESFTAPANTAFYRPRISWSGTVYVAGTTIRSADAMAEIFEASETATEGIYFDGAWLGVWSGAADASTSTSRVERINYAWDPRGTTPSQWAVTGGTGSAVAEAITEGASDGPVISGVLTDTYVTYTWLTGNSGGTPDVRYSALHVPTEAFESGEQVTVSLYVRPSIATAAHTVFLSQQVNGADGANVTGAAEAALPANVWTRVDATLTLTTYADGINEAGVSFGATLFPNGATVDVAYALIERVNATDDYFDGESAGGGWQGAENASISLFGPEEVSLAGTEIVVVGDLCAYPVLELNGLLSAPITIYFDGAATLVYNDTIAADDDPVFIDTRYTRAYQGGVDVSGNLSGTSAAALPVGVTSVTVTSSPSDSGTVTLCWQNAVISG